MLELCEKGTLQDVLRTEGVGFNLNRLIKISLDVAQGMEYLESRNIVYNCLATRKCLVTAYYDVKISNYAISYETDEEG